MTSLLLGALLLLTPGQSVNFFSLRQDVEIGSESAREAEQSLLLVRDAAVNRYVQAIGQRVVQNRLTPAIRYRFQIVNSKDINSLGFPGGAVYIYRGLLDVASNDDELAAIVAHEISHIASRHGTVQLSRQLLVQDPISIAAGLPASEVWKEEIRKLGISLGIDAPLKRRPAMRPVLQHLSSIILRRKACRPRLMRKSNNSRRPWAAREGARNSAVLRRRFKESPTPRPGKIPGRYRMSFPTSSPSFRLRIFTASDIRRVGKSRAPDKKARSSLQLTECNRRGMAMT